ncbi:hypothetical protein [Chryseobacterium oryctis]|uniref:Uncharacterized protein n=1 Tax=Chryseobacterium oryctis TaxID=2952618 RepID=A0ABT3HIR3_9FLAO|nr:hypothetical protein [Chryseobacterium oryctis]MCW3159674.1 hypothetical protein [Chryseobacterium oryctis]
MDNNKQSLLKIFSVLLKKKASEKQPLESKTISPVLIKYFTRKELVEMVSQTYGQELPDNKNLLELENEGILNLIESDYQIITYMCEKWLKEEREQKLNPQPIPENTHSSAEDSHSEKLPETQTENEVLSEIERNAENETVSQEFSENISEQEAASGNIDEPAAEEDIPQTENSENEPAEPLYEEENQEQTSESDPEEQGLEHEPEIEEEHASEEYSSFSGSKNKSKNRKHR